ncbi:Protein lunapark-B, partial [Stegodyphus mimosarum]
MKKEFESVSSKRSSIDSVVKYVLNEEKRNALICKHCKWHNGLALEEEFPFISFRCGRCFKMNGPARCMIPQPTTK